MLNVARQLDGAVRRFRATLNNGVVPFNDGRFVAAADRPALCARTYYESSQLKTILRHHNIAPDLSLEVGSGYGRLSPHLRAVSGGYVGVEPDDAARRRAAELYPHLEFKYGVAQALPFKDECFDLAAAWTVIQHIGDRDYSYALAEMARVTRPGGHILLTEKTAGNTTLVLHPRSVETYAKTLPDCELVSSSPRRLEPGRDPTAHAMLFKKTGDGS